MVELDSKKLESHINVVSKQEMQNTPTLFTQRLILRKFKRDDMQALYAIYSDKETNTYLPWFVCKNLNEAQDIFTQQYEAIYKQERGYHYAICLKEDNTPIGYVHIQTQEPYDLGYALCKEFWHKGYTREATRAIMQRALQDGIPYITATHDKNNHGSGAVIRALGMQFCYAYKERWQPKNKEVIFCLYQYSANEDTPIYNGYAEKYGLLELKQTRCDWIYQGYKTSDAATQKLYQDYHDFEWGVPQHDEKRLFEQLVLEGMQAGLSWITILKKREAFREAFDDFDPAKVAGYDEAKIEELMTNAKIIRNRAKIESAINNAKRFLEVQEEFGSFDRFIWSYVGGEPIVNAFKNLAQIPTRTPLSDKIAKDLKKRGFSFVGSVGMYAYMQSIGLVCDHLVTCAFHSNNAQRNTSKKDERITQNSAKTPYILETNRLKLQEYTLEDLPALHTILSDKETMYAWGHGFSIDESKEWLEKQLKSYKENGFGIWAIIDKASGTIIGNAGLDRASINLTNQKSIVKQEVVEIGYIVAKRFWGQGLGTEAARAVQEYVFKVLGLERLYCLIKEDNFASMRVARKLGGRIIGENIKNYKGKDLVHYIFECKGAEFVENRKSINNAHLMYKPYKIPQTKQDRSR